MSQQVGEMPDSNPGLQVSQSGALPLSHHIPIIGLCGGSILGDVVAQLGDMMAQWGDVVAQGGMWWLNGGMWWLNVGMWWLNKGMWWP